MEMFEIQNFLFMFGSALGLFLFHGSGDAVDVASRIFRLLAFPVKRAMLVQTRLTLGVSQQFHAGSICNLGLSAAIGAVLSC